MADFGNDVHACIIYYNEYDFASIQDYAKRTMAYGNFNTYRAGGNDLNVALTAQDWYACRCRDKDVLQNQKFSFNETRIKAFKHNKSCRKPMGVSGLWNR